MFRNTSARFFSDNQHSMRKPNISLALKKYLSLLPYVSASDYTGPSPNGSSQTLSAVFRTALAQGSMVALAFCD